MTRALLRSVSCAALIWTCVAFPAEAAAANPACAAGAMRAPGDARIARAVDEARRQHELFGGQTVERNGGMFRVGAHEAASSPPGDAPAWERVATFWRALSDADPPRLMTRLGWVERSEAAGGAAAAGGEPTRAEVAVREALLRAAIMDIPWSAAFISYLMKTAGFSPAEFAFSDSHADYVWAALETTAAESAGRQAAYAFRACDALTTRPRVGDLLCATRASTAGTVRFDALSAAMAARAPGQSFPMHCDLVVRADEDGDAKLDTVGGNVVNSVTLSRMTLNADKVLSAAYIAGAAPDDCAREGKPCREHLSRRPWLVLMQFRH